MAAFDFCQGFFYGPGAMNIARHSDGDFLEQIGRLTAPSSLFDPLIEQRTREILDAVQSRGDGALLEFTERFDGVKLDASELAVTKAELVSAALKADEELRQAILLAGKNVREFARRSLRKNWTGRNAQGGMVGEKYDPFERVGVYIPGGTAPLISTAIMTVTLATVAGCPEIVVCTPSGKRGDLNPALLYALNSCGATEVYRAGGAQAVAAMAFGTAAIRKVQKVFGPGNAYVVAAKRLLYGYVALDLLPGPSEVLVLADDSANPKFIAADLLAQAEHGSGYERVWLVTPSGKLLKAVQSEIKRQLPRLPRGDFIRTALQNSGWLVHVGSLDAGVRLANRLAPEHCEIMTRNAESVAQSIRTAGAVFIGGYTPTVLGDYVAGPSHVLPTGGAGASFSGLTVDQFQRRTSLVAYDRAALQKSLAAVQKFAEAEGLLAHSRSAEVRIPAVKPKRRAAARRKKPRRA